MLFAHYIRFQDTGRGFQRIYRGINTLLHDLSGKNGSSVQMGECSSRSRVSQVVGRYVYRLHTGNRSVLCGSDTLLELTHFRCQRRLITYRGRHTSKQSGYFGTRLGKTENIINEQQHVLMLFITEIFRHCKSGLSHTHTGARRLVHLSEYQSCFVQNAGFAHFCPQVVSFTGTLSHTGEYGISAVLCGNICDQLLDQHGLTYAGAAEQTDLTAFRVRSQQVDNLNAGFQYFHNRALIFKRRRISVDLPVRSGCVYFLAIVDGLAKNVKQTAQCLLSYRNFYAASKGCYFHISAEAFTG